MGFFWQGMQFIRQTVKKMKFMKFFLIDDAISVNTHKISQNPQR